MKGELPQYTEVWALPQWSGCVRACEHDRRQMADVGNCRPVWALRLRAEGFLGTADAIRSDWGFRIAEPDEEHVRKPVVIAVGQSDQSLVGLARYLGK